MKKYREKKLNQLLNKPVSNYENYHHYSSIKYPFLPIKLKKAGKNKKISYKGYIRFPLIKLPEPKATFKTTLLNILLKRESVRKFSTRSLNKQQLSDLLYYSAGRKKGSDKRFYPSAGACYPLEIYLIPRYTAFTQSVYHYYVRNHSLEKLFDFDNKKLSKMMASIWKNAPCFILISARFQRTVSVYNERGYRYILLEAGHLAQNVYLVAQALNLSCCAIGGYSDNEINKILDLDNQKEAVLYLLAVGNKSNT